MFSYSQLHRYTQLYNPYTTTFTVNSYSTNIRFLEHVVLNMSLTLENYGTEYYYDDLAYHNYDMYDFLTESHPRRGDIQVELTSPHGTKSVLLPYRKFDFVNYVGYSNWPFMSVHHWGESPLGTWKLKVSFKSSSGYVTVRVNGLELYGVSNFSKPPSPSEPSSPSSGPSPIFSSSTYKPPSPSEPSSLSSGPSPTSSSSTYKPPSPSEPSSLSSGPSPTSSSSTYKPPSPSDKLPIIIAITVGAFVFIILAGLFAIIACFWNYNKKNRQSRGYRRMDVSPVNT